MGKVARMMGVPAIVYDGDNAKAIVEAMGLEEGDAVVVIAPHKTIILRSGQIDQMFEDAKFETFRRDHFPPRPDPIRTDHHGLLRRLLEGET